MNNIFKKYNVIGDDFFYHHTLTEKSGEIYHHGPEVHRQYEVLYLIEGEISYIIEGETYNAERGDLIFVHPNEIHTLRINGNLPYERAVVLFDMNIIEGLISGLDVKLEGFFGDGGKRLRIIDARTVKQHGISEVISSIIECREDEPYKKLAVVSHLNEFIIRLDKLALCDTPGAQVPDAVDPLVRKITDYIDRHIGEAITLDDIASELFVSKSTLSHRFSSSMNMTLNRYIAVKKMHRANELMREGLNASEVCREVGYDNYTSFYYNYKQIMGTAPSAKKK